MAVALTSLSHGAGCGCKISAADLAPIVQGLGASGDPNVLIGPGTADDAGVYRLREDLALIQTVDFFTPIVDDPFDFGRVAATNALSDVYAMGGEPLSALNLVAYSLEELGSQVLAEILRGGAQVARRAGAVLLGGHSIDDREPKYGMAVTGTVHPDELISNAGARPGDALVLTKPLGVGAITTAAKRGLLAEEDRERAVAAAVAVMTELNRDAAGSARSSGAHALTDVTGFGLLGHLHELCLASGVAAEVEAHAVPAIPAALELLSGTEAVSGGSARNRAHAAGFSSFAPAVPEARRRLVCDAMTSGGLLVALAPARAGRLAGAQIGRLLSGEPGSIAVI
jgi:selenide,water dikinase